MTSHICYDITRLLTRLFRSTPNGIDRVDYMIARHILTSGEVDASAVVLTPGRPLLVSRRAAAEALATLDMRWRETVSTPDGDPEYLKTLAFLDGREPARNARRARAGDCFVSVQALGKWLARSGRSFAPSAVPPGIYVNCSQFPLWTDRPFRWLGTRKDVRSVFFLHDLLPLTFPEYFPRGEFARHRTRLVNLARFGSAAVVATPTVERELRAHLKGLGRHDFSIHVAPLPVAPIFHRPSAWSAKLGGRPFFLMCSTLEPRKNHLMILTVWRALVDRLGAAAPLLVLAGKRGWKYRPVADLLRDCRALHHHVLETNHLSTPALRALMDRARAVLMPTFAEGFGLPVYEALTAGAPVIASNIPAFRDIDADGLTLLSPIDGEAWYDEITSMMQNERGSSRLKRPVAAERRYLGDLAQFLSAMS